MRAPERGDLVQINFDPQSGREQAGRRPALVLSAARHHFVFQIHGFTGRPMQNRCLKRHGKP
jgi:mRNA interferase MazF